MASSMKMTSSLGSTMPEIKSSTHVDFKEMFRDNYLADRQYEILCKYIKDFQDGLDSDHEVCVQLASFGQSILMQVTDIGYSNPSLITFHGYVNNQYCELIQHVNQLSFLLMASPKLEPDKPARRIGFNTGVTQQ